MSPSEQAQKLVEQHGDQAYHHAAELVLIAFAFGEVAAASLFAHAVEELMKSGYHRFPKRIDRLEEEIPDV